MVADYDSGRGKEGMVEPVHVFDVSHFMSFREGGGRGKEEVKFSGGGSRAVPARRQVTTYTEVDFLCRGYDEFHELFSFF